MTITCIPSYGRHVVYVLSFIIKLGVVLNGRGTLFTVILMVLVVFGLQTIFSCIHIHSPSGQTSFTSINPTGGDTNPSTAPSEVFPLRRRVRRNTQGSLT